MESIEHSADDGVATITLDRSESLNVLSPDDAIE